MNISKLIGFIKRIFSLSTFFAIIISTFYSLGVWIPKMDTDLCIERYSSEDVNRDIPKHDERLVNDIKRFRIKANGAYEIKSEVNTVTNPEDGSTEHEVSYSDNLDKAGSWKETVTIAEGDKLDLNIEGEIDLGKNRIPSYDGEYILRDYGHNTKYDDMISWKAGTRIPRMDEEGKKIFLQQDEYPTADSPEKAKRYPVMNVAGGEKFEIKVEEGDTSDNSKEITDIFGNTISTSSCNKHHSIPVLCNMHYIGLTTDNRNLSDCNNEADEFSYSRTPDASGGQLLFFRSKKEGSEDIKDSGFMVNGRIANQTTLRCRVSYRKKYNHPSQVKEYCDNNYNSGAEIYIRGDGAFDFYDCKYTRGYDYDEEELKNRLNDIGFTAVSSPTITQENFSELTYGENNILELSPVLPEGVLYPLGSWDEVRKYGFTNDVRTPHERSNGGYYVKIKQSGMIARDNEPINKYGLKRGDLRLIVMPDGVNPNKVEDLEEVKLEELTLSKSDKIAGKQFWKTNEASSDGKVWALIRNDDSEDRRDSRGSYNLKFIGEKQRFSSNFAAKNKFSEKVVQPATNFAVGQFGIIYKNNFKRLVCYDTPDSNCSSFMTYVRLLLNIYIVITAMQYLLGSISLSQTEVIKRITKVAVISMLTTGGVFEFFDKYVFDLVTVGGMQLIGEFTGGVNVLDSGTNPFAFADDFLGEIVMSKRGIFKILALASIFPHGMMMCFITMISTAMAVQAVIRVVLIYIIAYIAIALLLSLAPVFLTFILFEKTKPLFDNWVSSLVRYMLEPVIVFIGVPVLVKFITIYFDKITGFSVCFKCVTPFKIPMSEIISFAPIKDITIGCITWFAPWGYDPIFNGPSEFNMHMADFLVMYMVALILNNYISMSTELVNTLTPGLGSGESAPPSTGTALKMESAAKSNIKTAAKNPVNMGQTVKNKLSGTGDDDEDGKDENSSRDNDSKDNDESDGGKDKDDDSEENSSDKKNRD